MEKTYEGTITVKSRTYFHKSLTDRMKSRLWHKIAELINNFWSYWANHPWRYLIGKPIDGYEFTIRDSKTGNKVSYLKTFSLKNFDLDEGK